MLRSLCKGMVLSIFARNYSSRPRQAKWLNVYCSVEDPKWSSHHISTLIGLLSTCGLHYLLSGQSRKKAQKKWAKAWANCLLISYRLMSNYLLGDSSVQIWTTSLALIHQGLNLASIGASEVGCLQIGLSLQIWTTLWNRLSVMDGWILSSKTPCATST